MTLHEDDDPEKEVLDRRQDHKRVLFWGCFIGSLKGPCHIWPQKQTINKDKYLEIIVLKVNGFIMINSDSWFMQNNALCHTAAVVCDAFIKAMIKVVKWPS